MLHKPWGLRRIAADLEESQTPLLFLLLKDYLIVQHFLKWASYTKADIHHVMGGCLMFGCDSSYIFAFHATNTPRTEKSTYKGEVL